MSNYVNVKSAKKSVNEAFIEAIRSKSVKDTFMRCLPKDITSYGETVFDDAMMKATNKAILKFQDINEQYTVSDEIIPSNVVVDSLEIVGSSACGEISYDDLREVEIVKQVLGRYGSKEWFRETDKHGAITIGYALDFKVSKDIIVGLGLYEELVSYEVKANGTLTLIMEIV